MSAAATIGRIEFGPAPIGAVLERPTAEAALLWRLYSDSLDREADLRKKLAKQRKP